MSLISQVRSIIQDKPVYHSETITFDGALKSYRVKYWPIDPLSVLVTPGPAPATADSETGVLRWAAPPAPGDMLIEYSSVLLTDETITDLAVLNTDVDGNYDLKIVAASCLDSMATNQAIIQKVIKNLDLQTDGASLAKALRDHAKVLRDEVFDPKYQDSTFDIAEQINDNPGWVEKIRKDWMRGTS